MSQIFDDEETNFNRNLNTNNEYAKNYSKWRIKEEQNRLRAKYGEGIEDESSSSSDEDGVEITTALEKGFFQALACLKNKDPRIYDENVQFFKPCKTMSTEKKKKDPIRNKPIYLKDYERNIILEQGGIPIDEGEFVDEAKPRSPTYVEEQKQLKEGFQNILNDIDEEEEWGGIFKQRQKSKEEAKKEEDEYKNWLAGQEVKLKDKKEEIELKPLKDYWNKADLDESEKFLKDFILNQRFLDPREGNDVPTYDEIIHDSDGDPSGDEENIEKQDEFEHKYNFRFEEPDHEFMKRFPRTLDNSLRQKDVRRKVKRMELKERKKKEKSEKMQELKHLQELKRQEIEEKLKRLKEITGNTSLGFKDDDIDGEFDPEEHDRKMQDLFNNEFYSVEDGGQKPLFPELDEELEIENWDHYSIENEEDNLHTSCGDEDNIENSNSLLFSVINKSKKAKLLTNLTCRNIRLCGDYSRTMNPHLVPDLYPKPVFWKPRLVSLAYRKIMDGEIDKLLGQGIFEPAEITEWATLLVAVVKSDGNIRLCSDYSRSTNPHSVPDLYPMPNFFQSYMGTTFD
ncbi:hypothetical protein JTB14_034974 [Gonioctena quinquepunctata]|nr:hypothetical protein JTB14_034974 [Gonioctena quinquepunctata]